MTYDQNRLLRDSFDEIQMLRFPADTFLITYATYVTTSYLPSFLLSET
mgnify:CR=1 FL=1